MIFRRNRAAPFMDSPPPTAGVLDSKKLPGISLPFSKSCGDGAQLARLPVAYACCNSCTNQQDPSCMSSCMRSVQPTAAKPKKRQQISPLFCIGCGFVLIMGGGIMYWLEPGATNRTALSDPSPLATERTPRVPRPSDLAKAREREAQARAELERQAAEEAAERARRASLMADGSSEVQARNQREEMTRRQAAVEEAHRAAAQAEDAWKRFYKPSAACRDQAAGATVECVNEFVRAKREFEARKAGEASR